MANRRLLKLTANVNKAISLRAPSNLAADYGLALPIDAGTAGYLLKTDGAGNLAWTPSQATDEFAQLLILDGGSLIFSDNGGGTASTLPNNIAAFYKLDEATGANRANFFAAVINLEPSPANDPVQAAGKIGNAVEFFGGADKLFKDHSIFSLRPLSGDPALGFSKTFAFWAKASSWASQPGILSNWANGGPTQWLFYADTTTTVTFQIRDAAGTPVDHPITVTAPSLGAWHFYVLTYDAATGTLGLSIDNAAPTTTTTPSVAFGTGLIEVGNRNTGAAGLVGLIDAFGVWDRVITTAERGELYAAGAGLEPPFPDSTANTITLKAPAAVTTSYTLTLPAALPGSDSFVKIDATGAVTFSSGSATLQTAYDAGASISLAGLITLTQATAATSLRLNKTHTGGNLVLDLDNAGTGNALDIAQTGDGTAINVSKTAGTQPAVLLAATGASSGSILKVLTPSTGSSFGLEILGDGSGIAASITQNTTAATALRITQNTAATGVDLNKGTGIGNALEIDNDGTGTGLFIQQDGAAKALDIVQNGNSACVVITQTQNQRGLFVNKTGLGVNPAVEIDNDGTAQGLLITQDGAHRALDIIQNGNDVAFVLTQTKNQRGAFINKTGTGTNPAVEIDNDGTGSALTLNQDGAGRALLIDQDGAATAATIDQATNNIALEILAGAGSGSAGLQITHSGSGDVKDINGTSSRWYSTSKGHLHAQRFSMANSNLTISTGSVTINMGGLLTVDTEASAATDDLDTITSTADDSIVAGTLVVVKAADDARTVVVRDTGGGAGNIRLNAGGNRTLDNTKDTLALLYTGTVWLELSFSSNGA